MVTHQPLPVPPEPPEFAAALPFSAASDFDRINHHFAEKPLINLLEWSLKTFGDNIAQVTSFGPTGMVLMDHLARLGSGLRVITIDTRFLFPETYALLAEVQRRYPVQLDVRRPALTPEQQAKAHGPRLWETDPDLCCYLRKVLPLDEAMVGLAAWFAGLRRDQSATRMEMPLVGWDYKYGLVKITPLAGWTRAQVWEYIQKHNVPYNLLHDHGYASIGCIYCTIPSTSEADERSGRWHNHPKTECGLHLPAGPNDESAF